MEQPKTEQNNNKMEIHASQFKLLLFLFGAASLTWGCFSSLVGSGWGFIDIFIVKPLAAAGLFVGGHSVIFLFNKYSKKEPSLIIDEQGIHDELLPINMGLVRWEEIEEIEMYTYDSEIPFVDQEILGIVLKDVEAFKQKVGTIQQKVLGFNHWFPKIKAQINLPIHLVGAEQKDVIEHIRKLHPELVSKLKV